MKKKYLIAFLFPILLFGLFPYAHAGSQGQIAIQKTSATISVEGLSYSTKIQSKTSVLQAMRALSLSSHFTFTGREFPALGFFVESINGKKNAHGYYWIFYLNNKKSATGVLQTSLNAGDSVLWKYEKGY